MKRILYTDDFSNMDREWLTEGILINNPEMDESEISDDDIYNFWLTEVDFLTDEFNYTLKSVDAGNNIIAIGSLGLWDGRVQGYRLFDSLDEITACCEDYNTFEIDRYNNLTLEAIHHDGTNYITFREMKSDLSDRQIENFLDKLYYGKATNRDVTRYTRAIGKYFTDEIFM